MHQRLRRSAALIAAAALIGFGTAATADATQQSSSTAPYCGIFWGSLDKSIGSRIGDQIPITDVRTGRHECYDRVVLDLNGQAPLTVANYVYGSPNTLELFVWGYWGPNLPSGTTPPVHLAAGLTSVLSISARPVSTYGQEVFITTRGRLPFREFVLAGPGSGSRVVIDIAHRW